jgi:trans-AT polyketide synthase, acyltransferase and oxidoreductase domains
MADSADRYGTFLESFSFAAPQVPVVANVTGQIYPSGDPTTVIRRMLKNQITKPVQWVQCVRQLRQVGVTSFREIGPGGVLTKLCQQVSAQAA